MRARETFGAVIVAMLVACARSEPTAPAARPPLEPAPTAAPQIANDGENDPAPSVAAADSGREAEPVPLAVAEPEPPPPPPDATASVAPPAPPPKLGSGRDPRMLATKQRTQSMLIAEVEALERLYAATPKTAPDRAALLKRLAEGYVELRYSGERSKDAHGAKLASASRRKAIEHYKRLLDEYPSYPQRDEVLYFVGYEYERAKDLARARAMYRELVAKFPSSRWIEKVPKALRPR